MPREDGLPTYQEATGLQRMLPQNISRQISSRITDSEDDQSGFCCSSLCLCLCLAFVSILLLGILMILFGHPNIFHCPKSWLPIWLVVGGSNILIFYTLCLLFSLRFCYKKETWESEAIVKVESWVVCLIYMDTVFGLVWYVVGCYWTWRSVDAMLYINRKIRLAIKSLFVAFCWGSGLWGSSPVVLLLCHNLSISVCGCCLCLGMLG